MYLKFICAALLLAALVIFAACNAVDTRVSSQKAPITNPPASADTAPSDGARRITTTELATLLQEGKVYLIDVRLQDAYDLGHIPGSRLIPAGEILNHVNEFPRDKMIVTYCS
jgi:3-mercaptopyruvate sulfurtransferase SseA